MDLSKIDPELLIPPSARGGFFLKRSRKQKRPTQLLSERLLEEAHDYNDKLLSLWEKKKTAKEKQILQNRESTTRTRIAAEKNPKSKIFERLRKLHAQDVLDNMTELRHIKDKIQRQTEEHDRRTKQNEDAADKYAFHPRNEDWGTWLFGRKDTLPSKAKRLARTAGIGITKKTRKTRSHEPRVVDIGFGPMIVTNARDYRPRSTDPLLGTL
jgi:hypothetical protein